DLTYIAADGTKQRPIMLHRVIFGSIERFIGIITEHYAGAFPLWLAPNQINIIPVNNASHLSPAQELASKLKALNYRVTIDEREEKLSYKMRASQMQKIPYTIIIGDKEVTQEQISYRLYGQEATNSLSYNEFSELLAKEVSS
ncbi:MAG TPA: His/Gly/Thr/Pro-type tRNA ligase C-terminal domain-containing protein, partial [Bacilli bacterium]|nr:His/Gly/Thr/Pro-type tRNA ligase C-terminal domain-containing protein [Bacilli bacterium]